MPITPQEAHNARTATTARVYERLDRELQEIAREGVIGRNSLTLQLGARPRDVVERVLADWKAAGWPQARIVSDPRDGDYISLD